MKKFKVGIIGATGMVGQRFVSLLAEHPWFDITVLAASAKSAGKSYKDAVNIRWSLSTPIPPSTADMLIMDAADIQGVAALCDFVFCAVDMEKDKIKQLEEAYAKAECPVVSNNSANRGTPDVPMVIPEVNFAHLDVINHQRKRLGTKKGFIAVKSNCSLQGYVPALAPLAQFGIDKILTCTYQAISGAGKTFQTWPEMLDNVIPYIDGEEEKSEQEPLKIWGRVEGGRIVNASAPSITSQCIRVPVSDGHMAAVFVTFAHKPTKDEIINIWNEWFTEPQKLALPLSPKQFLNYTDDENRPQTRLDRDTERGMAITIGRLREDSQYHYKFVCLSHNTLRGAAGGAVLLAELLAAKGYFETN